jgi:hypothetical protein
MLSDLLSVRVARNQGSGHNGGLSTDRSFTTDFPVNWAGSGGIVADHEVRLTTKGLLLNRVDLCFQVKIDGRVLGDLFVSEGGLDWRPKSSRKRVPITWTEFARWAEGD